MEKRPSLFITAAFCAGIITAWLIRQVLFIIIIFSLIIMIYVYCARKGLPCGRSFFLIGIFLFLGYINYAFQFTYLLSPLNDFYGSPVTLNGYINSFCEEEDGKITFQVFVDTLEAGNTEFLVRRTVLANVYNTEEKSAFYPGRHLIIRGELRKPDASRNPGGFNYQNYLLSSKTTGFISAGAKDIVLKESAEKLPLLSFGYKIREIVQKTLERNLTYEKSALMLAMLTGNREKLTPSMDNAFSASGLVHIMAVSGANIAFLLMPLLWFFRILGFNRRVGAAAAIPVVFLYTFITGMEASVLRASIMALVMLVGRLLDRKADLINSLCVSSLIILVFNPFMLMDVGFQLSVGATAGLGILYKKVYGIIPERTPKAIRETAAATIAAQAGVMPLLIVYFSKVSVVSLFSNIAAVPLTGVITVTGMIAVILDNISHSLGIWISYMLQSLLHIILLVTGIFASIPWAELNMKHWGLLWVCLYYSGLLIIGYASPGFFTRHIRKTAVYAFILGIVLVTRSFMPNQLKLIFIDVGQGDSALIHTAGGTSLLIDGGGSFNELDTRYIGQSVLFPVLMHERISRLDYIIISHGDADHMYGAMTLMEILPVGKVLLPGYKRAESDFSSLIALCEKKGTEVTFVSNGDVIRLDNETDFEVLYPVNGSMDFTDLNNTSLCGMLKFKQLQVLFTGDIEREGEEIFLREHKEIDCDILKVSHHGGKNGSSKQFIDALSPEAAVISVGRNNYGHPSHDVLNRLTSAGAKIYTTIEKGAVITESNGLQYKIRTWLRDDMFTFVR